MRHFIFCCLACTLFVQAIYAQPTITWKHLDSMALHMQQVTYAAEDTSLKLFYATPQNLRKKARVPAVVWIHGGAWAGGKANAFFTNAAYCALRGAVGFSVEYRLINNPNASIYDCIQDCRNAIRYIIAHAAELKVDTNKIVIVGESAGGHLAACMALLNEEKKYGLPIKMPYAFVLYNPVVDVSTGTFIKFMDAKTVLQKNVPVDTLALMQQYKEQAKQISPLYIVQQPMPPTLILNGDQDKVTPYPLALAFADRLKKYNTPVTMLTIAGKGHAFSIPHYKESEQVVIDALLHADRFLTDLKVFSRSVTLVSGNDVDWIVKKK